MPYLLEKYHYNCFHEFCEQLEKQYNNMPNVFKNIFSCDEFGNSYAIGDPSEVKVSLDRFFEKKGIAMILQNDICNINISVDETYTVDSADNKSYDLVINPWHLKHGDVYKAFSIEIDLFYKTVRIVLIGDFYSYADDSFGFGANCAILEESVLTVLQNNAIVQIDVNNGTLLRFKMFECFGSNYGIYKVKSGYIIYGEIELTMLDFDFSKKWSFMGKNIFKSGGGKKSFELCEDSVKLYDFENNFYEIDFMGNLIAEE